jgi:type IV secretory pathway VirB2 component (pilin)
MSRSIRVIIPSQTVQAVRKWVRSRFLFIGVLLLLPIAAHAQSSPFDSGFNNLQTLFTGTIAKAASLIAIVIGGYGFAHGEPGAKKTLAGVAAGTGIAVMATNVLSWLWGSYPRLLSIYTRFRHRNLLSWCSLRV